MTGPGLLAALAASACLATGCGAAATLTAGSQAPALDASLVKVDSSLEHGRYPIARSTLFTLINEARAAERAGSISTATAARIIHAARELLASLPRTAPAATPAPLPTQQHLISTSPSATPTRAPTAAATPAKPTPTEHPTPSPTEPTTPGPSITPSSSPTSTSSPAVLISPTP